MTPNDFLKIIQDSIHKQYEPVPDGWYSVNELCDLWKLKRTSVLKKIGIGIKIGIIEKKDYFLVSKNKTMYKTPHYFFHDEKKHKSKN